MNYRHAFHAGNFADVAKHLALVSILDHLKRKSSAFVVIDSHAGRGLYDLAGAEAQRSGEAARGIGRLCGLLGGPAVLQTYLGLVGGCGANLYPGSPVIAARMLRPVDRLVALEKHPEDAAALKAALAPFRRARVEGADGYARTLALLPPPERRGLILIDPPYEAPDEFALVARTVTGIMRRFATGIVMVWFPVKSPAAADALCGEAIASGARSLLRVDIEVESEASRLARAGLLVANPPFGFAQEMREALEFVAPRLGGAEPAKIDILPLLDKG